MTYKPKNGDTWKLQSTKTQVHSLIGNTINEILINFSIVDTNLAFLIKRNNRQMEGLTKFLKVLVRLELRKMTNFGLLHGKK